MLHYIVLIAYVIARAALRRNFLSFSSIMHSRSCRRQSLLQVEVTACNFSSAAWDSSWRNLVWAGFAEARAEVGPQLAGVFGPPVADE